MFLRVLRTAPWPLPPPWRSSVCRRRSHGGGRTLLSSRCHCSLTADTATDGPTADAASAADDDMDEDTNATAIGDAASTPSKKRRRSGGPARAAREAAFLASKAYDATDNL